MSCPWRVLKGLPLVVTVGMAQRCALDPLDRDAQKMVLGGGSA
jgi:hypothetical protein